MTVDQPVKGPWVGFTGSQKGMSAEQLEKLCDLLELLQPEVVCHGDCIGADAEFHMEVSHICPNAAIFIYPGDNPKKRSWRGQGDPDCCIHQPAPVMERNQRIVDMTEILIAAPRKPEKNSPYSGTWATIRRARKAGKEVVIIWPNGDTDGEWDCEIDE